MKNNQIFITIIIIIAICLYYFGYDICHFLYNQYEFQGAERQEAAKKFWRLRFSNYSVILAIAFYIQRFKLNYLNKSLCKIGFNLALISSIDKLIFNFYDFSFLDKWIFIGLILWEVYLYLKIKRNELYKKIPI